jgi:predicted enzyme related to lactoylglutathione lyase
MKISELKFTGYPISDVERSRYFYENVLGLELSMMEEIDPEKGMFWIEYNIGDNCLAISNFRPPSGAKGGPFATLEVDDLDKAMEELKAAGDYLESEIMESPTCRFLFGSDPDGNPFWLHQVK